MRLILESARSGQQILEAFGNTFPRQHLGKPIHWQLTGSSRQIEYEVIENVVKRHVYRSCTAVPLRAYKADDISEGSGHDPVWGDIASISLAPVREDKTYDVVEFVLDGISIEEEGRRTENVKVLIDKVMQDFHTLLLVAAPATQAA